MGPETEGGDGQTGSLLGKGAWGRSFLSLGQRGSGVTLSEPPRFITGAGMRTGRGAPPWPPPSSETEGCLQAGGWAWGRAPCRDGGGTGLLEGVRGPNQPEAGCQAAEAS